LRSAATSLTGFSPGTASASKPRAAFGGFQRAPSASEGFTVCGMAARGDSQRSIPSLPLGASWRQGGVWWFPESPERERGVHAMRSKSPSRSAPTYPHRLRDWASWRTDQKARAPARGSRPVANTPVAIRTDLSPSLTRLGFLSTACGSSAAPGGWAPLRSAGFSTRTGCGAPVRLGRATCVGRTTCRMVPALARRTTRATSWTGAMPP